MFGICVMATPVFATIFSTVKGVVHDPQHRPVPGATVTLGARQADWSHTVTTDADGAFQITAVPVGDYTVTIALPGFTTVEEPVTVVSGTVPDTTVTGSSTVVKPASAMVTV